MSLDCLDDSLENELYCNIRNLLTLIVVIAQNRWNKTPLPIGQTTLYLPFSRYISYEDECVFFISWQNTEVMEMVNILVYSIGIIWEKMDHGTKTSPYFMGNVYHIILK